MIFDESYMISDPVLDPGGSLEMSSLTEHPLPPLYDPSIWL